MATSIYPDRGTVDRKVGLTLQSEAKLQKCFRCGDKCPGLDLHFWRKICKHCRCSREDHDINVSDCNSRQPISMLIESIPRAGGSQSASRLQIANVDDPKTLSEIRGPENDVVLSRVISENVRSQKYISMLPSDKQVFAAQLRRKQLQKQLPLHDLHPKFCTSLTESEMFKFQKFTNKRRLKAAGVGNVTDVPGDKEKKCHRCLKMIERGGFCVFADRFGKDLLWHPSCFTCATCGELLVDMVYFYRNEDIYCERHYADSIYPRCSACDEIIFAREYTQAEKQTWHVEHFCCWYCDAPLAGQRYIAKNGNPYCILCFGRLFSKMCNTCGKTITADSPGLSHGEFHWHACPHCFSCHSCSRNLINQQFLLKEGRLFCSTECKQRYINGQSNPVPVFH